MLHQALTTAGSSEAKSLKTRVFLSYSRRDAAFTRRLSEALTARPEGYAPDFDQSSCDPEFYVDTVAPAGDLGRVA